MSEPCRLCPLQCGIDRDLSFGACRAGSTMRICRIAPHFYEEPPISGTNGSGTVFFSGCSLDCEFCQNYKISKSYVGKPFTPEQLADELKSLEESGVHNINFVSPTHFSDKIRMTLDIYRPNIPIVYNTSGYELSSVVEELLPYVDVFLTDMKYSDDNVAIKYSKRPFYVENCKKSLDIMIKNKPLVYENNLLKQGVIIRHLVLPGNLPNTFGVIDYYAENYKSDAVLSIMSQFVPLYNSSITRKISPLEYKIVLNRLYSHGIENCFIQDLDSATDDYVPEFYTEPL